MNDTFELTTPIGDGIVQIRLPMAGNPLRYVNSYLLDDDGGHTLIDCGWKAADVRAALDLALARCGLSLASVRRLAITHFHFDHYGLAGTLRREGVAELLMHRIDWGIARDHLSDPAAMDIAADDWIARNGFAAEAMLDEELQHQRTEPAPPTRELEDGERIGRLRAVWTPGHTPGHLCFLDTRSGRMLTGDHVLDPITPHVGIWREHGHDPLGDYVASLRKVAEIGASGVLPAHGEPFADLGKRVGELLAHHDERERHVLAVMAAGAVNATAIARALPWTRRNRAFDELSEAHRQFAVAETIAHLEHLRVRGLIARDGTARPIGYALR